jgi:hypothetical protein
VILSKSSVSYDIFKVENSKFSQLEGWHIGRIYFVYSPFDGLLADLGLAAPCFIKTELCLKTVNL